MHQLTLICSGYVYCKSDFYSTTDVLSGTTYAFQSGVNDLVGDIDAGHWAASCLLSMYQPHSKKFITDEPMICLDQKKVDIQSILSMSCYMDVSYPLFSSRKSVKRLIGEGLRQTENAHGLDEILTLFGLCGSRLDQPVKAAGNSKFNAMSAIAYAHGKRIFCFPWLSGSRYAIYQGYFLTLFPLFEQLDVMAIVPHGASSDYFKGSVGPMR